MKRALISVFMIASLVLFGCAQVQVLTINSMEKDKDFYKGREISYKSDDNVRTELEIDGVNNGKIYFYTYIRNKSDKTIEIRPEEFFMKAYYSQNDLEEGNGIKHWAFDPERALSEIEEDMEKAKNWKDVATGFNCCVSFFSFVGHITSDDKYEAVEAVGDVAGFAVRNEVIQQEYKGEIRELHSEKEFWRKEVLRRTVLKPDEEIGGIVVLPLPEKVRFLQVTIPFEKKDHTYLFELRKTKRR